MFHFRPAGVVPRIQNTGFVHTCVAYLALASAKKQSLAISLRWDKCGKYIGLHFKPDVFFYPTMHIDPNNPPQGAFLYPTETHYDQLDGQMLLHHPRYLVLVERAQQQWFEEILNAPRFDWQNFPDMYVVVRKLELDYVFSIDGVRDILVLLWPGKIRAASQVTHFAFLSADGQRLHAYGYRQNCKVDPLSHEPRIWSDAFREQMEIRAKLAASIKVR